MSEATFHDIEAYLDRQLRPDEEKAFELRLAREPELQEALAEQQRWREAITLHGARQTLTEVMAPAATTRPLWQRWQPYVALAASFALIVAVWRLALPGPDTPEAIYAAYFTPAPGLPTTLGISDNLTFQEGMIAYKRGNYAEALASWQPLLAADSMSDTLQFYAGLAQLGQGAGRQAQEYLQSLTSQPHSAWQADASWYLALSLLQAGEVAAARKQLTLVMDQPKYQEKARELLAQLSALDSEEKSRLEVN